MPWNWASRCKNATASACRPSPRKTAATSPASSRSRRSWRQRATPRKPTEQEPIMSPSTQQANAMTKDDIFARIVTILNETFDIDAAVVTPASRLYDDLEIDSIDAVDLIVQLKPLVGKRLQPEAF